MMASITRDAEYEGYEFEGSVHADGVEVRIGAPADGAWVSLNSVEAVHAVYQFLAKVIRDHQELNP